MSESLSEEELKEVIQETKAIWPIAESATMRMSTIRGLVAEIDRLRAENKELREIVGECREYVSMDNVEHDEPMDTDYRDPSDGCSDRCRGCFREVIMDRIDKALEEK